MEGERRKVDVDLVDLGVGHQRQTQWGKAYQSRPGSPCRVGIGYRRHKVGHIDSDRLDN